MCQVTYYQRSLFSKAIKLATEKLLGEQFEEISGLFPALFYLWMDSQTMLINYGLLKAASNDFGGWFNYSPHQLYNMNTTVKEPDQYGHVEEGNRSAIQRKMLLYKDCSQGVAMHNFCARRIDIIMSERI